MDAISPTIRAGVPTVGALILATILYLIIKKIVTTEWKAKSRLGYFFACIRSCTVKPIEIRYPNVINPVSITHKKIDMLQLPNFGAVLRELPVMLT
jgi:hypothetical protein